MKSCFVHNYDIPFETYFHDSTNNRLPLIEVRVQTDIQMNATCIHQALDFPGGPLLEIFKGEKDYTLRYAEIAARFFKTRIELSATSFSEIGRITQLLERVVFPLHLHLQNPELIALHGGAVLKKERAYLFLGESGAGKSTTVTDLIKEGSKLIADDLIFIDTKSMTVLPGLPAIRLLEKSETPMRKVEAVGPGIEKWWHLLNQSQIQQGIPIGEIFLLKPGPDLFRVEPSGGFTRVAELLAQTFGLSSASPDHEKKRFNLAGRVAKSHPHKYLHFRKGKKGPIHISKLISYMEQV